MQAAEVKQAAPKRHKLPPLWKQRSGDGLILTSFPSSRWTQGISSRLTMMHSHNKIQPGTTMDEIVALRKANPGGGLTL